MPTHKCGETNKCGGAAINGQNEIQTLHHIGTIADTNRKQNTAMNDHFEYLPNEILSFPLFPGG